MALIFLVYFHPPLMSLEASTLNVNAVLEDPKRAMTKMNKHLSGLRATLWTWSAAVLMLLHSTATLAREESGYLSSTSLPPTTGGGVLTAVPLLVGVVLVLLALLIWGATTLQQTKDALKEQRQAYLQKLNELDTAKRSARSAYQAKKDFLSNMSHEFRTPLNAILGMSQLALDSGLEGKQKRYIERVISSGNTLLDALNTVLAFTNVKAGNLEIEWVECHVETLLSPVVKSLGEQAAEKNLQFHVLMDMAIPKLIDADSVRITQVLMALGNNAVKFTDVGEVTLSIALESRREDDVNIRFSVHDTGLGIRRKDLDELFLPFNQADNSTSRRYGGKGLGLSLSRELVALMGGELNADSRWGEGSVFSFTLPCQSGVNETSRLGDTWSGKLSAKSVLLVSSNMSQLSATSDIFIYAGATVSQCRSLEELQEKESSLTNGAFDYLVAEWESLEHDMLSFLTSTLTRGDRTPSTIIISGPNNGFDVDETRPPFSFKWVQKPVLPSALMDAVSMSDEKAAEVLERKAESPSTHMRGNSAASAELRFLGGGSAPKKAPEPELEVEDVFDKEAMKVDGKVVLLVEDNLVNQEVAIGAMEALPLEVLVANNGGEAVQMLKEHAVDLVLMDMQMPVVDGVTATKMIRQELQLIELPILAMTANTESHDVAACREAGMNGHIAKPIDFNLLRSTLLEWLLKPTDSLGNTRVTEKQDVALPQEMPTAEETPSVEEILKTEETLKAEEMPLVDEVPDEKSEPIVEAPSTTPPKPQSTEIDAVTDVDTANMTPIEPVSSLSPDALATEDATEENDAAQTNTTGSSVSMMTDEERTRRRVGMDYDDTMFDMMVDKIPGINLREGVQRLGGNKAKYLKILSLFLTSQATAMEQLLTSEDTAEKAILAHSCKGAGSNIGATEIADYACGLEDKYNSGETVSESDVLTLKNMIVSAIDVFDDIVSQTAVVEAPVVEEEIKPLDGYLVEQLNSLQVSLQEFDIEVQDKIGVLSKALPQWCHQMEEFKRLQDAINQFDFITAEEHLKDLKKKTG
ncbi:response regulator [Enterovibrio norvegicus]|uniref:histidine kinase n=1 Tax=Enterovibrio norvegicus TaxID=188144 RepID=A0A2N7LIB3_9GAMM|nr:response regulator [Enterovibrio norvegicus]PMN95270.1 hybrid sensor histidine kinase/response regulator [Enterovibrio norvegicus]